MVRPKFLFSSALPKCSLGCVAGRLLRGLFPSPPLSGWNLQSCSGGLQPGACVSFYCKITFSLSIVRCSPCFRLQVSLWCWILSLIRNKSLGFKTGLGCDLACPVYDHDVLVWFQVGRCSVEALRTICRDLLTTFLLPVTPNSPKKPQIWNHSPL